MDPTHEALEHGTLAEQQQQQQQQDAGKYEVYASESEKQRQETQTMAATQRDNFVLEDAQVEAALRQDLGSDARLVSWVAESLTAQGDNYLGALRRLRVTFHKEGLSGHTSYVAKVKPSSTMMEEFMAAAHKKECLVYCVLVPWLNAELQAAGHEPLRLPRCFFSSDASNTEVIILEDLGRRGFKVADRRQGLDTRQAELVVREVARLHAASHMLQTSRPSVLNSAEYAILVKDWHNYSPAADVEIGAMLRGDLRTLATVAEAAGGREAAVAWLRQAAPLAMDMFRQQVTDVVASFRVLCHGDCWVNNFLFRYDNDRKAVDVVLIDLQLCRWGSPALDLNTFAFTSLDFKTRRAALPGLLNTYSDTFSEVLQARGLPPSISRDQLLQQCRDKSLFALLMGADYLPAMLVEGGDTLDYNLLACGEEEWTRHIDQKMPAVLSRSPLLQTELLALIDDFSKLGIIGGPLPPFY